MSDLKKLQSILGYEFKDESLLKHALTHSSMSNEEHTGRLGSNERLEFLGDAVLELASSDYFYAHFPEQPEGELTRLRASFVCEAALYRCAEKIPLSEYIYLGKGEEASGGRQRPSVVSDAFEAVLGAIYLDGGFANAKDIIEKFVLDDVEHETFFYDSKTTLQEIIQKEEKDEPEYVLVGEDGPDHKKQFKIEVRSGGEVLGTGVAQSKKQAAQNAAYEALKKLGKV